MSGLLFVFQLLFVLRSHLSSPRADDTNFEICLFMFPINSWGLVTQCLVCTAVLILFQVWQGEWSTTSRPGHDGGAQEIPTRNHECRDLGTAQSVLPYAGSRLWWSQSPVFYHVSPHLACGLDNQVLGYRFSGSSDYDRWEGATTEGRAKLLKFQCSWELSLVLGILLNLKTIRLVFSVLVIVFSPCFTMLRIYYWGTATKGQEKWQWEVERGQRIIKADIGLLRLVIWWFLS